VTVPDDERAFIKTEPSIRRRFHWRQEIEGVAYRHDYEFVPEQASEGSCKSSRIIRCGNKHRLPTRCGRVLVFDRTACDTDLLKRIEDQVRKKKENATGIVLRPSRMAPINCGIFRSTRIIALVAKAKRLPIFCGSTVCFYDRKRRHRPSVAASRRNGTPFGVTR